MKPVVVDFESFYEETKNPNDCSVKVLGPHQYVKHPKFDAYMVSVFDTENGGEFVGHPDDFDWRCIDGRVWAAHNAGFDRTLHRDWVNKRLPPHERANPTRWIDTAGLAAYLRAPRSLGPACEQLYGKKLDKGMRDWMNGKTVQDAKNAGAYERLCNYAMEDSRWAGRILTDHLHKWPEFEQKLADWTVMTCDRGIRVDLPYCRDTIAKLSDFREKIEENLPWASEEEFFDKKGNGMKPTSTKGLALMCRKVGIPPPASTAEDAPEYDAWDEKYGDAYPWVRMMTAWRKTNKLLKMFETLVRRTDPSTEIFSFGLKYFGAHTGRWSGDTGLNMQGLNADPLIFFDEGGNVILHADLRRAFIARPGKKFVVCDLSQIEARITPWFAGETELLNLVRGGMSIYEAGARLYLGWKGGKLKVENETLYAFAKARELGLGFGCGWQKYIHVAKAMAGLTIDAARSKAEVRDYRAKRRKVVNLWGTLDGNYRKAAGGDFEIELPSGRKMRYFNLRPMGRNIASQVWLGGPHRPLYGGLLLENIVQATAREVLGEQILDLESQDAPVLFPVHDEAITEVDQDRDPRDVEEIMSKTPAWLEGCPIGCEWKETPHYL